MCGDADSKSYLTEIVPKYFNINKLEKKFGGKMANIEKDFFPPKI